MRTQDKSYIYYKGASPNTRVALSQKNKIYSKPYGSSKILQIGVVSSFSYNESRNISPVRGVGFGDRLQDLVPSVTEPVNISMNRTLLYTSSIAQEVGYKGGSDGIVRSLRHHKWPFDIRSELVFSELVMNTDYNDMDPSFKSKSFATDSDQMAGNNIGGGVLAIITMLHTCWFSSLSVNFTSDNSTVAEDANAVAMDITDGVTSIIEYNDLLESGNNPFNGDKAYAGWYKQS